MFRSAWNSSQRMEPNWSIRSSGLSVGSGCRSNTNVTRAVDGSTRKPYECLKNLAYEYVSRIARTSQGTICAMINQREFFRVFISCLLTCVFSKFSDVLFSPSDDSRPRSDQINLYEEVCKEENPSIPCKLHN